MLIRRRKIKVKGKSYFINVYTYYNSRIRLKYENSTESHDITLNLKNLYLDEGKIFLDPALKENGILKELKKTRIIKEISSNVNVNNIDIPVATLNMGILRQFDFKGVKNHFNKVVNYE